jgi:outer membrane lipoprotein-sorting protein
MKIIMKPILLLLLVFFVNSCASVKQADESLSVTALPTDVSAEAGNGKVTIRWNGVSGADSYSVYMSLSPGTSKKNFDARKTTTSTSYSWTGLTNGTSYYFVVTAQKKDRESNDSSEVTATPKALEPAPKPPKVAPKAPEVAPKAPEVAPKAPEVAPKASKLTPQELLIKADEIRAPGQNFVQDVRVILKKGNTETASNRLVTRVKGHTRSLAIFKEPPTQKGQVLLMLDNNMWIYFPTTKKPIRISPAQQLLGNVSNADVARVVYNIDYKAESVEEETSGTDKLLRLFLKAKTEGAAYGSIKLWLHKDSYKLNKAEFYTLAGRLLKTTYYKGYKQLLGKDRPTFLEIHDAVKKDEITTMEYLSMKIEDTPDNYFQRAFMDRASQL